MVSERDRGRGLRPPDLAATVDPRDLVGPVLEAWGDSTPLEDEAAFDAWMAAHATPYEPAPDELAHARTVCTGLARTVARATARPAEIDAAIDDLLAAGMPGDPGWQEVLAALREAPGDLESFKLLALARYRRHLLQGIGDEAGSGRKGQTDAPATHGPAPAARSTDPAPAGADGAALVRLVRGERVEVARDAHGEVELWLGGQRFVLTLGPGAALTDARGGTSPFREGANLVGRVPYAEVMIDERYADVSRRHLVVEVQERSVVALTDLSSRGTCVPLALVEGGD